MSNNNLIHRYVKPGNILLRTSDRRPLLTDFGLVTDRWLSRIMSGVSVSEIAMDMIDFMAPEQGGDALKVTRLADQWSPGPTLEWLITGDTMRTLRERDLRVTLRETVFKATEKQPQDRFGDLQEFRAALKSAVSGPAVSAPPVHRCAVCTAGSDSRCNHSGEREFCAGCGESTREACQNVKCQQPIGVWERFCPECGAIATAKASRSVTQAAIAPFSGDVAKATQVTLAKSPRMREEWTNSVGMKFLPIPTRKYKKNTLTKLFWAGIHQVTLGQWNQVMGTTSWKGQSYTTEGLDVAVSSVSWNDAVAFCEKLSKKEGKRYRLPSEAECDWAFRVGPYPRSRRALCISRAQKSGSRTRLQCQ